jgi:hypothetical protein
MVGRPYLGLLAISIAEDFEVYKFILSNIFDYLNLAGLVTWKIFDLPQALVEH